MSEPIYTIQWSDEDNGFVATCDAWPSLSFIHEFTLPGALNGLLSLIARCAVDVRNDAT